jgi:AraC family transcriptional activator of mtrCDE
MYDEAEIFEALAPLLRVRPQLEAICRFGGRWSSQHEPEPAGWAPFHIVTLGACLLDVGDRVGIPLKAGDVAVLPHGPAHTVRALSRTPGPISAEHVQRRLYDELVVKSNLDGEPDTKLICGRMCFEHPSHNMVLAALPPVVVLASNEGPDQARLRRIVDAIRDELEEGRLGGAAIAAILASSLMLIVLTIHLQCGRANNGIFALLTRPQTAKALAGMLAEPARDWTLDELADRAGTSRATLVRFYRAAVGMAPFAFLSELRFTLARHRIRTTKTAVAVIAEEIGYESEASFSRAYRRRYGTAPGADRKGGTNSALEAQE